MTAHQAGNDFLNAWTPRSLWRVLCWIVLWTWWYVWSLKRGEYTANVATGGFILAYTALEVLYEQRMKRLKRPQE